jgi:hypothetical protein
MGSWGTDQSRVKASSRLYSGRWIGYSVPTVNATLYIMSKTHDGWTLVYQAQRT